ncbi:MAG TPA: GNAT family N-acetyltransferase [Candidatus Paceibacterota bacterium]|nr:GNAT family N-acetyltransferase [Candidatus Paceibacterota bacterium]
MEINLRRENKSYAIKVEALENSALLGSAYLYIMFNDLHKEPFGFLENVFVQEVNRGSGIGKKIVQAAIEEAKIQKCYKIICTSRSDNSAVHTFYNKLGFSDYGKEFRLDL